MSWMMKRQAFMDFFNLVGQEVANESQSAERVSELPNTVTYVPRKRSNNDPVEQGDASNRSSGHKENSAGKGAWPAIASADESSAMEEYEPETEMTPVSSNIVKKGQGQTGEALLESSWTSELDISDIVGRSRPFCISLML